MHKAVRRNRKTTSDCNVMSIPLTSCRTVDSNEKGWELARMAINTGDKNTSQSVQSTPDPCWIHHRENAHCGLVFVTCGFRSTSIHGIWGGAVCDLPTFAGSWSHWLICANSKTRRRRR